MSTFLAFLSALVLELPDDASHLLYAPSMGMGNSWAKLLAASHQKSLRQKPGYAGVECHRRIADRCQIRFSKWLKAETNIFRSPKLVTDTFQKQYNQSLETGLLPMCAYRASFFDCLQDLYEPCTDLFQIYKTQRPIKFEDAFVLSFLYKSLAFDCLGGNVQLTSNYNCFLDVQKNPASQQANEICHKTFHEANKATPQDFCANAQAILACASNVFLQNTTCPSKELAWWRCEHIRTGIQATAEFQDSAVVVNIAQTHQGNNDDERWRRKLIGGGAFVSNTRLNVYKKMNQVPKDANKARNKK